MKQSTQTKSPSYRTLAQEAIGSPKLRKSLANLQERFGHGAMTYWADMEDQDKRKRVKDARMKTLAHLDLVLEELAKNVERRGGKVHFAATANDAVQYTREVARNNQVKMVVKGKSMTSMEIDVDRYLEEDGIEVVETDLGEYIVQLAQDKPSHIIAPCIHMDRDSIGRLFEKKLDMEYTNDPPTLTMAARKSLREKLLGADMGLTGCNLACAETGHISLVSNEGNIRMSTTMPRIHVAIMGIERVVATLSEHREALQLLTRGAALQKLSTYVSFIGGPASQNDGDGPEEFHLIILDNGRSKILADPEFREVLACIRCGACLNICPVYGRIGGHAYNSHYGGPIGAVISPLLDGINKHADLCRGETLCGACKDVCPVENDLPRMLSALRHKLAYGSDYWNTVQRDPAEARGFELWASLVTHPRLYRAAMKSGRLLQWLVVRDGKISKMFGPAAGWCETRDLPPLARESFGERWKRKSQSTGPVQSPRPEPEDENDR